MLIPSIDVVSGRAVQLVGGERLEIEGGDPFRWMDRFSVLGEVAVVDIDAARGDGDNRELIEKLCSLGDVRVGGGIRDLDTARRWLDSGAAAVVIGTAASPELLSELPRDRVIAAIDSRHGEVLSHGWREQTGDDLLDRVSTLAPFCGGVLTTFVELEGQMRGTDIQRARSIVEAAGESRVTIAGGIVASGEIASLDQVGADAQVGMALYSGELDLTSAFAAPLVSDRADGLWPTVVTDQSGIALGLAYSSLASLREAIQTRRGVYHSRKRGLWRKGESSGSFQELLAVRVDCDRDALRFTVRQHGNGFCHSGTKTCWGEDAGLTALSDRLSRIARGEGETASNTRRLLADNDLLRSKLLEEAAELAGAGSRNQVVHEAADLAYFTLVKLAAAEVTFSEIEDELDRRARRVSRRRMTEKPERGSGK